MKSASGKKTPHIQIGSVQVSRLGLPRYRWHDVYHMALTLSWPGFFAVLIALYLGANALFALAYLADGNGILNARPGSFSDAFFFSVETMATVGYGIMSPNTLYSHIVSMTEVLAGMLGFAMATGLMFARFSRPRPCLLFSDVAVIGPFNGVTTFMIRVANKRHDLIVEPSVRMSLIFLNEVSKAGDDFLHCHDLKLVRDRAPILALSWTVMHVIDESSPFYGRTPETLNDCAILVSFSGLNETMLQTIQAHKSYGAADIRWGGKFVDILSIAPDGERSIDYSRFHEVESSHSRMAEADRSTAAPLSLPSMLGLFLKIGAIGFGGSMAVIAILEQEFVQKRRQLPAEEFLHAVGLAEILGSFAPNTVFFLGYRHYGLFGALVSVAAFLLPSVTIVIFLSFLYSRYHAIPALQGVLVGLGPVVIALILAAAWSMGRRVLTGWPAVVFAVAGVVTGACKVNAIWVLLTAGIVGLLVGRKRLVKGSEPKQSNANTEEPSSPKTGAMAFLAFPSLGANVGSASFATVGLTFLKIGLVFFGGGFVLIPVLHQQLVEHLHWLTPQEFLDGVAISNLTPGPIAVLATFAGYHLLGVSGALLATVALLTPAMILMAVICIAYERLKTSSQAQDFLAAVAPTVVGLIASAALLLWHSAIPSWRALLLMAVAMVLLIRFTWHPAFVLAVGATLAVLGAIP
ncbi:chromate efflux transporter [Methylococcus geothermalis]|uniref:Chromate efflux transporter n=1 Tax=Methylococcus geothermalis TaxID=2681310 RepID=A0A858Q944_9GAMM|nr:chromate efflux transporter [Methylococcus geothermalis]QJD30418.1 chromate efflux transporter [Methylococcus geothermalis]